MKAILVIDMPDRCWIHCPCWTADMNGDDDYCFKTRKSVPKNGRPDWCPLRPLPDEKEQWNRWELDFRDESSYRAGWNDFRKEIYEGS